MRTRLLDLRRRLSTPRKKVARRRAFAPALEVLESRTVLTSFTLTSPTSKGLLPAGVTPVGGIVLDLVGVNGARVVSQLAASSLFQGGFADGTPAEFRGNPGIIGIQTGLTPAVLSALGGGLTEVAVRVTLFDGDSGADDFDVGQHTLLLNGVALGSFSRVVTQETSADGQTELSENPGGGFRDDRLDTGFFFSNDPDVLGPLYATLAQTGGVTYQLLDREPFDNFFDFLFGIDGSLLDVSLPPAPVNLPPVLAAVSNDGPVSEGSPVRVTVVAADPDADGGPLTYQFDFDDDGAFETSNASGIATHLFADDGTFIVRVRVTDAGGVSVTGSTTVEVRNVAPRLESVDLPARGAPGGTVTLAVRFTDPGRADTYTVAVDWGGLAATLARLPAGSGSYEESRALGATPGTYAVRVTVRDNGGGEVVATLSLVIEAPPPVEPPPAEKPAPPAPAPVEVAPARAEIPIPAAPAPAATPAAAPSPPEVPIPVALLSSGAQLLPATVSVNTAPSATPAGDGARSPFLASVLAPGQYLVGGSEAAEPDQPPAIPGLAPAVAAVTTRTGSQVADGVMWLGRQVGDFLSESLGTFAGVLQAGAARMARAGYSELPSPAVVTDPLNLSAASPTTNQQAPSSAPPARVAKAGPAVRTGILVLAALMLQRSWSDSRGGVMHTLRRQLLRRRAAAGNGKAG